MYKITNTQKFLGLCNDITKMFSLYRSTICSTMAANPSSVKLRKLELNITKNDDDVIRFLREIFLEELKRTKYKLKELFMARNMTLLYKMAS